MDKKTKKELIAILDGEYSYCDYALYIRGDYVIIEIFKLPFSPFNLYWDPRRGSDEANRRFSRQFEGMVSDMENIIRHMHDGEIHIYVSHMLYNKLKSRQYELIVGK